MAFGSTRHKLGSAIGIFYILVQNRNLFETPADCIFGVPHQGQTFPTNSTWRPQFWQSMWVPPFVASLHWPSAGHVGLSLRLYQPLEFFRASSEGLNRIQPVLVKSFKG